MGACGRAWLSYCGSLPPEPLGDESSDRYRGFAFAEDDLVDVASEPC